jgi:hypothetical protein
MKFITRIRRFRTNRRADTRQNPQGTRPPVEYDARGWPNQWLDTDQYRALHHPPLAELPTSAALMLEVTGRVHAHFKNGGIDDGNADFLDDYLDKKAVQHHLEVERHFQDQLQWVLAVANQERRNAEVAWRELATITADLDEADADYIDARNQLLGKETTPSWRDYNNACPAPLAVPEPGKATATHARPAGGPAPVIPPVPGPGAAHGTGGNHSQNPASRT